MERVAVVNVLRQQVHAVEHYPLVVGQRAGTGPIVEQGDAKAGRLVFNGRSKVSGHVSVVWMVDPVVLALRSALLTTPAPQRFPVHQPSR